MILGFVINRAQDPPPLASLARSCFADQGVGMPEGPRPSGCVPSDVCTANPTKQIHWFSGSPLGYFIHSSFGILIFTSEQLFFKKMCTECILTLDNLGTHGKREGKCAQWHHRDSDHSKQLPYSSPSLHAGEMILHCMIFIAFSVTCFPLYYIVFKIIIFICHDVVNHPLNIENRHRYVFPLVYIVLW